MASTKKSRRKPTPKKRVSARPKPKRVSAKQRIQNELEALAPVIARAERSIDRIEQQIAEWNDNEIRIAKRQEAARKGQFTRAIHREEQRQADALARQKKEAKRRGKYKRRAIRIERTGEYRHFFVQKLNLTELMQLVGSWTDSGIVNIRFVVEIPATPAYPGGFRTKNVNLAGRSDAQIRRFLGGMLVPGREHLHKLVIDAEEVQKLDEGSIAAIETGKYTTSEDMLEERRSQRIERRHHKEQLERDRKRRNEKQEAERGEREIDLHKLQKRMRDARRTLNSLIAERRELKRRLK